MPTTNRRYPTDYSAEEFPNLPHVPKYCMHKTTGQGVVYIDRKPYYLGPYGSADSLKKYQQILARWQARRSSSLPTMEKLAPGDISCSELVSEFFLWGKERYRDLSHFKVATRRWLRLYADTPISQFGPVFLELVRSSMVVDGLTRQGINSAVHRIRWIVRWGVRRQLVDESVWNALKSLPALSEGEEGARESEPVSPARWYQLRAILRKASPQVRDMAKVQILTGMRPGELVTMRPCEIDRSDKVWIYRPPHHKTKYKGKERHIAIGVRAQEILLKWWPEDASKPVFQPGRTMAAWDNRPRRVPAWPSHSKAVRRRRRRQRGAAPRRFTEKYTAGTYRNHIRRACMKAYPLPAELERKKGESPTTWMRRLSDDQWMAVLEWRKKYILHPHQLRHSFATRIGNRYGEEAAQKLLGHGELKTTRIYVERDIRNNKKIIAKVG